jgi:hypothetical protein
MLKKSARRILALLTLAPLAVVPWISQPIAVTASSPGTLFAITQQQLLVKVDPSNGQFTVLTSLFPNCSGNCPLDSQSFDLTSDPTNRRLFAERFESFSFNFPPVFVEELLTIDSQTGAIVSHPQFTQNAPGEIAFDTSTHTLFGFTGSEIVKVDPTTAALTPFATIGSGFGAFIYQMTISSTAHTVYLSQEDISLPTPNNPTTIFSIDTVSGAVSPGVVLDTSVRWVVADGSQLFGITDNALNLVAINTTTGATTFVANMGFNSFIPSGPTVDQANHTIYTDVAVFTFGFQDNLFAINDQTGASTFAVIFPQQIVSIAFEGPPPITSESIKDDVRSALASGAIDNAGIARSLLAKLNAAADAREGATASGARTSGARLHGCATAAHIYQAFINELTSLSGATVSSTTRPHVLPATAARLISEAQFLIANCP